MAKTETDVVILSIKLASGDFESSLRIPVSSGEAEIKKRMDQWFNMISFALQNDVTNISATLDNAKLNQ